jgi:Zn-dependent protease
MWRDDYENYGTGRTQQVRRVSILGGGPDLHGGGPVDKGKFGFSQKEINNLGIAILILTVAFALALSGNFADREAATFVSMLIISFIVVTTGFAFHEMAHKFVAQKYGHWAEFRYSEMGLFMALIFGFLGIVIAAPGAVYIMGRVTDEENGKISAAGPLTNVAITLGFFGIFFVGIATEIQYLCILGIFGSIINSLLAGFNMIPFPPLDGSKIWRWNIAVYIGMIIIIGIMIFYSYTQLFDIYDAAFPLES